MTITLQVVQAFDTYKAGDQITVADNVAQTLANAYPGRFQTVSQDGGSGPGGGGTPGPIITPANDLPADYVFPLTADPANDLPRSTRAVRCQTGGTMVVNTVGSQNVTLAFADGETRPVRVTRVLSITGCSGVEGMA